MKILLVLLLLVSSVSFSQKTITVVRDTTVKTPERNSPRDKFYKLALVLSNGRIVADTSKFLIGKGSLPNGDFNFIATASNTMEAKLKKNTPLKVIEVIKIKKKGKEKYGYTYTIYCEGGYHVQLEDAVLAGEIILD